MVQGNLYTPEQRALLLYQNLSDRAWIEAEELNVEELASAAGLSIFKTWVQERYQEVEVSRRPLPTSFAGSSANRDKPFGSSIQHLIEVMPDSLRLIAASPRLPGLGPT